MINGENEFDKIIYDEEGNIIEIIEPDTDDEVIEHEEEYYASTGAQSINTVSSVTEMLIETKNEFDTAKEDLIAIFEKVLKNGEITADDRYSIRELSEKTITSYSAFKDMNTVEKEKSISEQLEEIKADMVQATPDDILNVLTEGGTKCWIYKDDDNNVLIDGTSIPELTMLVNKLNLIAIGDGEESAIKLTPEFIELISSSDIKLKASNITLEGLVTANENFKILEDGSIVANNGTFTGKIFIGNNGSVIDDSALSDGIRQGASDGTLAVQRLEAVDVDITNLKADKADITDLNATNAEIENLKTNKADIEYLTANYATIENLNATNANVSNLQVTKANITDLNAVNAEINNLKADKADITDLNAVNADIEDLKADKADVEDLTAVNAEIENLKANKADIDTLNANVATINQALMAKATVGDLNAANAKIANLEANKADIEVLEANYATIEALDTNVANINTALIDKANVSDLNATKAIVEDLKASKADVADLTAVNAKITNLEANKADVAVLEANYATIKQLDATNANVTSLQTETANINKALINKANVADLNATNANVTNLQATKANVSDLNAAKANISSLTSDLADITTLVNGNLTSDNIQSMVITGDKFTVADGFIKNAMIDSVNANKINAGSINTNKVTIQSNDGSMVLKGNLQQFKDKNGKVRIQIGKDATGNFTFALYDENGTGQLINEKGIQSSNAIKDGLIVDSKVAANANIAGSKLDIDSVVTEVNNGTTSIKGTKIYLDKQKQTLDAAFNNMSTTVSGNTSTINSHTTSINTMNGKVSKLISDTTITQEDGTTTSLKDAYNSTVDTVNSHTQKIGSLTTNLATVNNNISSVQSKQTALEQNLNGFKTTVSETYTTKADFNNLTIGGRNLIVHNGEYENTYLNMDGDKVLNYTTHTMRDFIPVKPGELLTFQKEDGSEYFRWNWYDKDKNYISRAPNQSNKFTWTVPANVYYIWVSYPSAGRVKLERGNKATDWTPAPEDVDAAIGTVDSKFNNYSTTSQMNSAINQKANEITSTVSETYATKASLTTVDNKFANYSTTSAINTAINQKSDSILSTVSKTYATQTSLTDVSNNLANNYSTTSAMNTAINQKADSILSSVNSNYATKTALNTVDGKFANYSTTSAMNSAINQKGDSILSTVSSTYATKTSVTDLSNNLTNNYSTTSAMNSAINQKANEITSSVSSTYATKTDFNNLTIGGTNLFIGSKDFRNWTYWHNNQNWGLLDDKWNGFTVAQKIGTWNGLHYRCAVSANKQYTFSAWVKSPNGAKCIFYIDGGSNSGKVLLNPVPTEWTRVSVTSTISTSNDGYWHGRLENSLDGKTLQVCGLKLEEGNKATTWSPAPQDIDASINAVDNKFANYSTTSQMNSAINQKANEITSSVSQTYATKASVTDVSNNLKNNYSTTSAMNSAINQKANEITSSVSETYATKTALNTVDGKFANYSTTSAMNSAINQKSDAILSTVSSTYATKTSLNEVDGKFADYSTTSAMNTAINQKADSILSTVNNTYATKESLNSVDGKFANYSTTSDMHSAINQKGDSILSSVSNTYTTKAEFNNLEIGGTNLVLNSSFAKITEYWTINMVAWSDLAVIDENTSPTGKALKITVNSTAGGYGIWQHVRPRKTGNYTLSFYAKADTDNYNIYAGQEGSVTKDFVLTTNWTKYTHTYNKDNLNSNAIIFYTKNNASNSAFYIHSIKLEYGNKATDWTPAPEDINASITAVDNKLVNYATINQMNSAINQKANEINLNVSNTYATKSSVTDLNNNLTNNYSTTQQMNSAIDIAKSGIKLDVSNNYASKHEVAHYFEGENKWKLDLYSLGSMSASATPTKDLMIQHNCQYLYSILVEHPSYTSAYGDTYVGYATTYMYFTEAYQWTGQVATDDAGSVYLNDEFVLSTTSCQFKDITLNFRAGWNKVEVLYAEGGGGDGWQFNPEITVVPGGIMNKMNCYGQNSTEEYLKANYSTTEQMNSAINIAKDSITSSVSQTYSTKAETNDKINNIKVGGTNFIRNGRFKGIQPNAVDNVPSWTTSGGLKVWTALGQPGYDRYGCIYYHKEACDGGGCYLYQDLDIDTIGRNIPLTLSFDAWREGTIAEVGCRIEYLNANKDAILATENLNYNDFNGHRSYTFTTSNDGNVKYLRVVFYYISVSGAGGGYLATIGNVKLEKGNKDTDWSPAPQDIDASIEAVDGKFVNYSTIQQMNSAIDQKANEITSSVSQTYSTKSETNNQINDLQGQINNTNNNISNNYASKSELQQTTNSITAKFSESGGYNLLRNSRALNGTSYWSDNGGGIAIYSNNAPTVDHMYFNTNLPGGIVYHDWVQLENNTHYIYSAKIYVASPITFNGIVPLHHWCTADKTAGQIQLSIVRCSHDGQTIPAGQWVDVWVEYLTASSGDVWFRPFIYHNGASCAISVTDLMLCKGSIPSPWSPHPSEVYDGITRVDKDGVKVYHGSIDGQNYTHMAPTGFYINNRGEDVFKVDTNGLYLKGNVTITNGSVPSSLLSGQISDGLIGEWIKNGATNGSNAKATLDDKTGGWDNTKLIVDTGHTNWDNAKSTLDNNAGKWNSTTDRVNGSSAAWDNAYNRVVDWAYGAVGGTTTINGGLIQTNTITTKQLAIGDFNNYSQLRPYENLSNRYGTAYWGGGDGHFYWSNNDNDYLPFTINETANPFKQWDKVGFKFEAYAQVDLDITIGIWFYSTNDSSAYMTERAAGIHIYPGWNSYSTQVHIDCNEVKYARSVAIMISKGAGNYLEVRNVVISRMINNVMIEDGAITANKISAGAVTADKINVSDLSALNASVGGFHIYSGKLVGTGGNGVGMSGNAEDWAFWAGSNTGGNAPFHVGHEGNLYATQAYISGTITASTITGSTINGTNINSDSFVGDMLAIDGTISAKSLQVQDIDNARYPATLDGDIELYVNSSSGNDDNEPDDGVRFKTLQGAIDAMPKFLNGKTVYITMETDSTEDVYMRGFVGGAIRIYMNGKTLYGTLRSYVCAASINVYGGTKDSTEGATGVIHPNVGLSFGTRAVSVGFEASQYAALYKIKVYAPDNIPSDISNTDKVCIASQSGTGSVYCKNIQIVNAVIGFRTNNHGSIHVNSSSGVASKYGFQAVTGGIISMANNNQAGGKTANTNKSSGGQIWHDTNGPKFATGNQTTDGGTAPVAPTTKTLTIKSSYGDTYRSTVYNSWKRDGSVRGGDYGYGDCNGCWFFGSAFSEVKGKTISKVEITITRNSGGKSSAVGLVVKSHGYSGRPSGAPTYRTTAGTLSLATGATGTLTITNSTILNEIKSGAVKGFGIQNTYNSDNYAVCSGSCTVKITYTE